ncbi:tRNA (guanine-N1)-methyltransferase [Candidatus Nitrosarchaeum limnium]|jgi:tRNA (guanine26-N2/guanine27-N2)-dimethyltransferase|uniref:tRNA (guanine(26)-N(2))-dimethyltransferase n=1 Tax=Candidatus Nitrosarchaeum limnium BG20 TaxID=859192 RepID=S2E676_9ARCH|nr:tRNA (guanine-N1)-methyltransferase [Candidatus Nitrosarchaeum limnium]EPA06243.1 N2,N2-dimethylguanosine tRNA methyltransferase [Candidatus Nitrosarchaeum limnium BG20]
MEIPDETFVEIIEGKTKVLVPKKSITDKVPPKEPAFFNPKARVNRDYSVIAYSSFLKKFVGPKIFLEGLTGVGIRGLRVANELQIEKVIINDLNPTALKMAKYSAQLNKLKNIEFSEMEVCRFLSKFSKKDKRGSITDIDPFGSPAPFFDCGIRATMHGGILSTTATDLQVLNGLYQNACKRKYGGIPIRVEYGNEMAIRLMLGCLRMVAGRIGVEIVPLFAESNMHYYRIYVQVLIRQDQKENIGYILHCKNCGDRRIVLEQYYECELCKSKLSIGGPLWIDKIFDKEFVENMILEIPEVSVDKVCEKTLQKCLKESEMPGIYFTLDEIAAKMKSSPPKLEDAIKNLQKNGYIASPTSFCPTGFRTNANIKEIIDVFSGLACKPQADIV